MFPSGHSGALLSGPAWTSLATRTWLPCVCSRAFCEALPGPWEACVLSPGFLHVVSGGLCFWASTCLQPPSHGAGLAIPARMLTGCCGGTTGLLQVQLLLTGASGTCPLRPPLVTGPSPRPTPASLLVRPPWCELLPLTPGLRVAPPWRGMACLGKPPLPCEEEEAGAGGRGEEGPHPPSSPSRRPR